MTLPLPTSVRKQAEIPAWLTLLLAAACGLIAANIYYAQPLVGPISGSLGLSPQAAGLVVTMTQLGYGAGLLLVVPLGDLSGVAPLARPSAAGPTRKAVGP